MRHPVPQRAEMDAAMVAALHAMFSIFGRFLNFVPIGTILPPSVRLEWLRAAALRMVSGATCRTCRSGRKWTRSQMRVGDAHLPRTLSRWSSMTKRVSSAGQYYLLRDNQEPTFSDNQRHISW
jgi:hypothetical protein